MSTSMEMASMSMSGMPSMTSMMSDMASATASSMPGMDHHGSMSSSSMMMDMSTMKMTFFTSTATPLYSSAWTPSSRGAYAGTCIFLIALALLFRALIALRCNFLVLWARWSRHRHGGILEYTEREEQLVKQQTQRRPWRVNEAAARAVLDTVLAGVSYLLMLAVMTMNVGYFMSILGGTFLGSFIVGGWTGATATH